MTTTSALLTLLTALSLTSLGATSLARAGDLAPTNQKRDAREGLRENSIPQVRSLVLLVAHDSKGRVTGVSVTKSSGDNSVDAAAIATARNWRVSPGTRGGRRIAGKVSVPVTVNIPAK